MNGEMTGTSALTDSSRLVFKMASGLHLHVDKEIESANLQNMKVADLRRELKARGLGATGNKTELINRLQAALANGSLDSLESPEEINEDDVLAEDSLLNDEVKGHDLIEDDILDAKDIENVSSKPVRKVEKEKVKAKSVNEKPKITITRNTNIIVPLTSSPPAIKEALCEISLKTDSTASEKKLVNLEPGKDAEKLNIRVKRFGVVSDDTKLKVRAERFGNSMKTSDTNISAASIKSSPVALDVDRLKQRAARFGQVIAPAIKQVEEKDKLLKRTQRFGVLASSAITSSDETDIKKKRLARFASK